MDVRDLKIDSDDLDRELSEQAANFLYVAELAVNADQAYENARADFDRLEATVSRDIRTDAADRKEKLTEKAIAERMALDPKTTKGKEALISAKGKRDLLKALREAWAMRKDTLLRIAMVKRSEIEAHGATSVQGTSLDDLKTAVK
jgi:1,2-phenylacetyl-CoA epoxidase PaaB subunit